MGMAGVVGRSCSKLGQAAQFHMAHIIILIITFTESFSQDGVTESFSQDGVLFSLCCAWPYNCITIQRYKVCQQQSFKGFICVCGTALMRSWFSHSHWLVGRSRGEKERGGDGGAVF